MTIKRAGIYHGKFRVDLPCKPYLAVRLRKAVEEDYSYVEPEEPVEELVDEPVEETVEEDVTEMIPEPFAEEPEAEEQAMEEPLEEEHAAEEPVEEKKEEPRSVDAMTETIQLPTEEVDDEDFLEELLENTSETTAQEAIEETLEEPVYSIKDELLEGTEQDLDLSSIPEFHAEEPVKEETPVEKTQTQPLPIIEEKEDAVEEEDDELPEIVSDSYLAKHPNADKEHTLDIPPISFDNNPKE